jgi:hypothetical protein
MEFDEKANLHLQTENFWRLGKKKRKSSRHPCKIVTSSCAVPHHPLIWAGRATRGSPRSCMRVADLARLVPRFLRSSTKGAATSTASQLILSRHPTTVHVSPTSSCNLRRPASSSSSSAGVRAVSSGSQRRRRRTVATVYAGTARSRAFSAVSMDTSTGMAALDKPPPPPSELATGIEREKLSGKERYVVHTLAGPRGRGAGDSRHALLRLMHAHVPPQTPLPSPHHHNPLLI